MASPRFGDRLKEAMLQRGMSQKALAEASGLTEGAVSRHLKADSAPRVSSVQAYERALGVSAAYLMSGREAYSGGGGGGGGAASLRGRAALDHALLAYEWPADTDMSVIDAAQAEVEREAETPRGRLRSVSAWTAYLDRMVRRPSSASTRSAPARLLAERRR